MVRRVLKVPPAEISNEQIDVLFTVLDLDGSGGVSLDELVGFAHGGDEWKGYQDQRFHAIAKTTPSSRTVKGSTWSASLRSSRLPSASSGGVAAHHHEFPPSVSKDEVEAIRHRIFGAAYKMGGQDYNWLFGHLDKVSVDPS